MPQRWYMISWHSIRRHMIIICPVAADVNVKHRKEVRTRGHWECSVGKQGMGCNGNRCQQVKEQALGPKRDAGAGMGGGGEWGPCSLTFHVGPQATVHEAGTQVKTNNCQYLSKEAENQLREGLVTSSVSRCVFMGDLRRKDRPRVCQSASQRWTSAQHLNFGSDAGMEQVVSSRWILCTLRF